MNHQIAFNPFRGGNKGHVSSVPLTEYDKTIGYPWLQQMVAQIRGDVPVYRTRKQGAQGKVTVEEPLSGEPLQKAVAKIKSQLPFRCAHYAAFRDDKRRQANILPEAFLFQTTVDVDEKELVETALEMAKLLDKTPGPWEGKLLHLEYSARKKLHIDIRMPIGMTIEETQRSYCEALGVPCDESCFSPERIIFITDKASELYRSPHWYEVLPDEELAQRRQAFIDRGLGIDGRGTPRVSQVAGLSKVPQISQINTDLASQAKLEQGKVWNTSPNEKTTCEHEKSVKSVKSVGQENKPFVQQENYPSVGSPTDKNIAAFDLFRGAAGLKDVDINSQGSRHSSLLAIMSAGASRVMSEEELKAVVAQKMPSFSEERDCQQLIHDFYTKYGDSSKPMSQAVIRINAEAEKLSVNPTCRYESASSAVSASLKMYPSASECEEDYPAPPPMPEKLPKLVDLLVSKTPDIYKPAVACAIFPPLATHLWRTTFRYIDNVEHEATLMCALLAGTGAGKNCVQMPINLIMADIRRRDRENLAREKAWKDEVTRKGANKDKRKRPENLIIQEIDADMTNPAFVMRTAEAQEHFLYTSLNEIDQFDALKGQGGQQFRIMCLAFDPGNQYGQTRVGLQSITERVCIRFNWNASTTIHKGQRYFARVLTDGPVSRINFCTIPEREIGADMPVYGTYDAAFTEALRPYIDNLCRATGHIECTEAYQLALKLKEENADFARMTQSRIYENLSFRANVIAYLKACVLYVANGMEWEPEIDDFIRWSERYDLYCKMRFFGDAISKAENEGVKSSKRGPCNLLQVLPDEFNFQEAEALRLQVGKNAKGTRHMLNVWLNRKYIRRKQGEGEIESSLSLSNLSFIKLKYRKDGNDIEKNS